MTKQMMLLSREVKRVPLDFDWPLDKVWTGYTMPDDLIPPRCPVCGPAAEAAHGGNPAYGMASDGYVGDGMTPEARQLHLTWYSLAVGGWGHDPTRAAYTWSDKLTQAEVDHLKAEGRLAQFGDHPTADEVNDAQRRVHVHDSLNCGIAVEKRCELLGVPSRCPHCDGSGFGGTPEQREAYEDWMPSPANEPPTGDGWQMWEKVSEGSPISPVFDTAEKLAAWLAEHSSGITEHMGFDDWMGAIRGQVVATDIETGAAIRSTA